MPNLAVIGAQWGDEGKGKIIDVLSDKAGLKTVKKDRKSVV